MLHPDQFSRIGKLFVDRLGVGIEDAERRLASKRVLLACGPEVSVSATLQAAVLTAANVGARCFPNGVHVALAEPGARLLLPWPGAATIQEALCRLGVSVGPAESHASVLAFGTRKDSPHALQVTFDRWVAAVAPYTDSTRLRERDACPPAGVLGGALGVAEIFLEFAGVTVEATRRRVGHSLWRPDLPWDNPEAAGPSIEHLPGEWWSLGLGHLGQAYLWTLGLLPYSDPRVVNVVLNDHDRIIPANVGTGMLTTATDVGQFKTRVAAAWLEARGFRPRLVERPFDRDTHPRHDEPALGLGGFDGGGPREDFDEAGFRLLIDCGLGGRADDFDVLRLHTLPNPQRTSRQLWPGVPRGDAQARLEDLVARTPLYREVHEKLGCGHLELAGRSVAVPFVGAAAGSFVVAEALRLLNGGTRAEMLTLSLESPRSLVVRPAAASERRPRIQAVRAAHPFSPGASIARQCSRGSQAEAASLAGAVEASRMYNRE